MRKFATAIEVDWQVLPAGVRRGQKGDGGQGGN